MLPTGNVTDVFGGIPVTCVDNGMPVVVVDAASFGKTGQESVTELEADEELNRRVQRLRLEAGKAMRLGDVSGTTVPKVSLVAPPSHGGTISTRTFIPVRVHESIGVLCAVSVGTAVELPGAVGHDLAAHEDGSRLSIEHPGGVLQVEVELDTSVTPPGMIRSGVVRTARKLFDGLVFPLRPERPIAVTSAGVEIRLKTAPWLSATIAMRPYGLSVAGRTTWPPWLVAVSTALSVSAVPKYTPQNAWWAFSLPPGKAPIPPTTCWPLMSRVA